MVRSAKLLSFLLAGSALTLAAGVANAQELTPVSFGTNWLAEAEHGGFYQAVADGTYERYGLDVTIVQGGPQSPGRPMLLTGQIDFYMSGNMLGPIFAAAENIPVIEVAAIFQKDPQVLMAHPGVGVETFEDLANLPVIFMGADGFATYFQWMKVAFEGFSDDQYRPYTFNPAPFIADPMSAQQGYITAEPFAVEREGGFEPLLFLLADHGFTTPNTLIETTPEYLAANPEIVQAFVEASIIGWYNYLYGDNAAANELIKTDNPEMTDEQIAFTIDKLKEYGLIDSGIALEQGIGCIDATQVMTFYESMVEAGVVPANIDVTTLFTTEFVCAGVGMELKP
ncbi:MAG: ABC transporter substrate-binding protein [Bauldia sp.]|nr:ABC transporter substrate-binding protein [Bauldia sp.]